jgi:hypothetical protein
MNEHVADEQLDAYVDGELGADDRATVDAHLMVCDLCRHRREALARLVHEIGALPRESAPSTWVRASVIQATTTGQTLKHSRPRSSVIIRGIAASFAAAAIFLAGRLSASPQLATAQATEQAPAAMAVQRAGTEYVAALARLSAERDSLATPVLEQGQEAGLAALYAAASEFTRLVPGDGDLMRTPNAICHSPFARAVGALVLSACTLSAQARGAGQPCYGVRPPSGTIGIGRYECIGSSCIVNEHLSDGYAHLFTTEPSAWDIDPAGPAAGKLHDGDVIVAVDEMLITSRAGGRRIANLTPGQPVTLAIRPRGTTTQRDLKLTPVLGCEIPSLGVEIGSGSGKSIKAKPTATEGGVDFGMRLDCDDCGWRTADGKREWFARKSPIVKDVLPGGPADEAGVKAGDVLDELDGEPLVAPSGSRAIGAIRPGAPVILRLRRAGVDMRLRIVPRAFRQPQ